MLSLRKIKVLFEFYKSTLLFSISFFILFLSFSNPYTSFFWGGMLGLLSILFLKETNKNKDYLFYLNSGLSKIQLYSFSLIVNLIIAMILFLFFR